MLRRHRSLSTPLTLPTIATPVAADIEDRSRSLGDTQRSERNLDDDSPLSSRELLIMGQNHILAFLGFMYVTLLVCRLGWGWTPGRMPPISIDMLPVPKQNVTIVTASYFNLPSEQDYRSWIHRFSTLHDNMIIFVTSQAQIPLFEKLGRGRPNIRILLLPLEQTSVVKDFGGMNFWERQASLDPNEPYRHRHPSKDDYIIWNEKGHFLQRAMDLNPYNSDFFAWVDMRYLRDSLLENQRMIRFLPTKLTRQQAILLDVRALGVEGGQKKYFGSGFVGGYKEGITRWIKEYYTVLDANRDRFLGNDQPWMCQVCSRNPGMCWWVEPRDTYGDPWHYMAPFLHGVSMYGISDHTRHAIRTSRLYLLIKWMMRPHVDLSALLTAENETRSLVLES